MSTSTGNRPIPVWVSPAAWLVMLVLLLYFFPAVATVALGVLAACIIACTLRPLMDYIPGPRGTDVALLGVSLLAVVLLAGLAISWPLKPFMARAAANWPETRGKANQTLAEWSTGIGLEEPLRVERLFSSVGDFLAGQGGTQIFSRGADLILGLLLSLTFSVIGSIFLLSTSANTLIDPALRILPPPHRPTMRAVLDDLAPRYRRWVIGTIAGMSVVFTASALGYSALGLKMAIPLAIIAGFAEIVPTVGPAVAGLIATLFTAATDGGPKAMGVLAVWGVIQGLEAYLILPSIMRGAVNIHPAVTLFSVVLWGKIFGVAGLMLAIPINLTIWTILDHFHMRPEDVHKASP